MSLLRKLFGERLIVETSYLKSEETRREEEYMIQMGDNISTTIHIPGGTYEVTKETKELKSRK